MKYSAYILVFLFLGVSVSGADHDEYRAIKNRLKRGWNTWDSRNVLSWVLLPEGFAVNLAFKQHYWLEEQYLNRALIGRRGEDAEQVTPGPHTYNGSYTSLEIKWQQMHARIDSAHVGEDLVILVTPLNQPESPVKLILESSLPWNGSGFLGRSDQSLEARLPGRNISVYTTATHVEDPYVSTKTPYLALPLGQEAIGISTGRQRTLEEIRKAVEAGKLKMEQDASHYGDLAEAFVAVQSGIAWNTIYEPKHDRVVSTVGRLWNEEYGGYCLFGWDNFFLAYMTSMSDRDLAFANVIEHLKGKTEEGFIPNDNRGNGSKSFDRSQPPVGGIMVREIYKHRPERWFLEAVFDDLLGWNRFWLNKRNNEGLLSYGSHKTKNPFNEPAVQSKRTAGYESGMDDSPMYQGVPFNKEKNTLELQDVGLNSLVIADCEALREMALLLGRNAEAEELAERAQLLRKRMAALWDEETGFYLNRRTDTGKLSKRLSPTLFYPLMAGLADETRTERIMAHFYNPDEFWGDFILPSIARNDPEFPRQRYWRGAIWPPLNFLTYLSLRQAGQKKAGGVLSQKSLDMFIAEWRRKGFVSENYSSITGTGDDKRLSSDRFHSWGALFGMIAFIEAGEMPAPEAPMK